MAGPSTVVCHTHERAPGYIACVHVMAGKLIAHHIEPRPGELGEALCIVCADAPDDPPVDDLLLVCIHCLHKVHP